MRALPLLTIAFACVARAQTVYEGADVQTALQAAVNSGATSYTLPPGRINLTTSLRVMGGTKNFTLMGQTGTRLVRNTTVDFPLIIVGTHGKHAYDNTAFTGASTTVSPVPEGATTVTRTAGQALEKGWYAIIGTHSLNDIVRTADGVSTNYFKRELVRVTNVSGNVATLDGPVGRPFDNAELRLVEADNLPQTVSPQVCQRITLRNLVLDGASTIDGTKAAKVLIVGLSSGVYIDDISVSNFGTSGISVQMSKGVTINRARVSQGNLEVMGYGIEFGGSRFVTVRNSVFSTTRTGVLFQSGTMDGLVEDCTGSTLNFDGGHGQGERRLTYRRVLGNLFTIANSSWRRGVEDVTLEDCTALHSIAVHGNASNVLIKGRYPGQTITTPQIYTTTQTGGTGYPSGTSYVRSLTLENGVTISTPTSGYNFQMSTAPDGTSVLGSLTIRNWTFKVLYELIGNLKFNRTTNSPNISITNCNFQNVYEYSASIFFGPSEGGRWNLDLRDNVFNLPGQYIANFSTSSTASWVNQGNLINGQPVTLAHVVNPGAIQ
ncbi:MAG: hypothetical protein JNK63_09055 [Chthonomonas sp.]|nr:hypothetical protein [Chthonomonas sp.]